MVSIETADEPLFAGVEVGNVDAELGGALTVGIIAAAHGKDRLLYLHMVDTAHVTAFTREQVEDLMQGLANCLMVLEVGA
ncbi:hypothetical protein [Lacisediminihabitans profunda]|uniref:Uncharacterized protein n=1 Tax=Lacisediminihabitans profunda TaxID=2594790 RepID=A0A5C8ULU7_9MICO|nr:hypothetical protein [Lacisediminihabitans profunda]TXN29312.1 hypothetical protein FVP33_14125 [Lacisediminihabitans profunda]